MAHQRDTLKKNVVKWYWGAAYLETLDIFNLGKLFAIGDARLKETRSHTDADGLRGHACSRGLGRIGNGPKGAKEEDEQVLRHQW